MTEKKKKYLVIYQQEKPSKRHTITRWYDKATLKEAKEKGENIFFFAISELKFCPCGAPATHGNHEVGTSGKIIKEHWRCVKCVKKKEWKAE